MRKSITYLSILFCFQLLLSQESGIETVNPKSSSSDLNEPFTEYYDSGTIKISGQKNKGVRIGEWKEYYDNEQVSNIYSYTEGKKDIPEKSFYENGNIKYIIKGDKSKAYKTFYYETGEVYVERILKTGNYKEYLKDGTLKVDSNYIDYYLTGLWVGFFDTGEKEWEVNYVDGLLSGTYKQFYKNGKIKAGGNYIENKKQGKEKHFTQDGKLDWEGFFDKGIPVKKWKKYNAKGKAVAFNKFKEGNLVKNNKTFTTEEAILPVGIIEQVPVYPGCEDRPGNKALKKCMNESIKLFIGRKFNTDIALNTPGIIGLQKISVFFKIDKSGNVIHIKARASHDNLVNEAKRVVSELPQMIPGTVRGKKVIVPYYLPIKFQVKK